MAPPPLAALWLGRVEYRPAWELQQRLAAERRVGGIEDCVLLLEHPPVFTLGRNTRPDHVPGGADRLRGLGAECWEVDRGGSVTFHGPGQLVAYPIVELATAFPLAGAPELGDVDLYLRALEAALCATAARAAITAAVRPPFTGAWVGGDKLAAIGVKLAGGVTTHGIGLNVNTDLGWFDEVVPCGIPGAGVTSLERLGAAPLEVELVGAWFAEELAPRLGRRLAAAGPRLVELTVNCKRSCRTAV